MLNIFLLLKPSLCNFCSVFPHIPCLLGYSTFFPQPQCSRAKEGQPAEIVCVIRTDCSNPALPSSPRQAHVYSNTELTWGKATQHSFFPFKTTEFMKIKKIFVAEIFYKNRKEKLSIYLNVTVLNFFRQLYIKNHFFAEAL